jgi:pimeloyl-ACP methyl ester carboxylesterase
VLLAALSWAACTKQGAHLGPRIALAPCRISGISGDVGCADYEVYEDRAARAGRKIRLHLAVVKALAPDPAPDPLFVLAGGPGQAATEIAEKIYPAFERVNRSRDIVFVDQRGTGRSHALDCEVEPADAGLAEKLASEDLDPAAVKRCLAGYDADVRLYTTAIAMDDLDEVRGALGYDRINLWGGSYGTRAALVYMRQHPDRVRAVVLDGVAPVDLRLPLSFAKDGQRALDLLFEHCEEDPSCASAFPGLRQRFQELLAKLDKEPAQLTVAHPVTGRPEPVRITRAAFTAVVRGLLYAPETASLLPLTIDRAASGDFGPFVAQALLLEGGFEKGMSLGMFFSVICSEDAPLVPAGEVDRETKGTFLGDGFTKDILGVCQAWPRGWIPEGYNEPVTSNAPALVLSGDLDPVTPPAHAEQAMRHLPRALHVIVPGVGHGVTIQGCVPRLVAEFFKQGTADGLDVSCARSLDRPPFFITFAGPTP